MSGDRFIPSRSKLDIEKSKYWLSHHTPKENSAIYYSTTSIIKQDIYYCKKVEYVERLSNALGINSSSSSVLPLTSNINVNNKSRYEAQWPVYPRLRPVYKPQLAVLDLPNIRNDICSNIINWSSSNHIIAALGKMIWLWHVPTSKMFKNISCLYDVIALKTDAPSSKLAYSCEEEYGCKLKIWSFETMETVEKMFPLSCVHRWCWLTCIEYHISNKYLIVGCKMGNMAVLDTNLIRVSPVRDAHNNQDIIKICCSPDGKYVASSGYDGYVNIWTFPQLNLLYSYYQPYCSRGISWHPWRTSYLCVGTTNGNLALLNTSSAKCIHSKLEPATIIYDVTFNKISGELVISQTFCEPANPGSYKSQINVLSRFDHVVDRFEGHCRRVLFLEWSPDNRILATAGSDETIHLWKFFDKEKKQRKKLKMLILVDT